MEKLKSEGKCIFCEKMCASAGMSRHLTTHLKKLQEQEKTSTKAYYLKISESGMFLHLLVNGNSTLSQLDSFLRAIWLECCGHLSSFKIKGKQYNIDWNSNEFGEKMSKKMSSIFNKDMILQYEYDFGSTTAFEIKVMGEYQIVVKDAILLLSRNEPLPIMCHVCETKPATKICSVCIYEGPFMFCNSCAKKHAKTCDDFDDYAEMPVVNSPRMGECAYDGGRIDLARDGVYVVK